MRAIIHNKFGSPDYLSLQEVEKPSPAKNQILLAIHAASVNAYDWRHIIADPFLIRVMGAGLFRPKHPVLGADIAGTVEAVGPGVKLFKPGDEVFGEAGYGGFAEYVCADENRFVIKPKSISFEDAAASPMAALTALQGLRDMGHIQSGQKVLINGASGGVGSYALQIAKIYGSEVTGVCSTAKKEFVAAVGADHVIDYTQENITEGSKQYDLIFDVAAYQSVGAYKKILKPGGRYVLAGGSISRIFQLMFKSVFGLKNMGVVQARPNREDMQIISGYLESRKLRSYIYKVYPLQSTAEAILDLKEGRVPGKAVISLER